MNDQTTALATKPMERTMPAAPPAAETHSSAVTSIIFGLATVLFNILAGIPAIILGHKALRGIKRSQRRLNGRTLAIIGIVLGWISVVCFVAVVALLGFGVAGLSAFSASSTEAKNLSAQQTVAELSRSVSAFYQHYEAYPMPHSGMSGQVVFSDERLMNLLVNKESELNRRNKDGVAFFKGEDARLLWSGRYADGLKVDLAGAQLWDPWGNPYRVRMNAQQSHGDEVIVWSSGPDGEDATADDIRAH